MKRLLLVLFVLMAIALFAESRSSINVSGIKGNILLGELSNNSTNNSSSIGENKTINLSREAKQVKISDGEWNVLFEDIMNSSDITDQTDASTNLSAWGSAPKAIPPPPDPRSAKTNEIIRQNHLGY